MKERFRMIRRVALFCLLVALLMVGWAGRAVSEVRVTLEADRTRVMAGDTINLVVRVDGTRTAGTPRIEGLEGFLVESLGTTTRFQITNGQVQSGSDHAFAITAKNTGSFTVGPASVQVDGRRFTSDTIGVHVSQTPAPGEQDRADLYVTARLMPERVYHGQECIYSITLFRRQRVRDVSLMLSQVQGVTFKRRGDPTEYSAVRQGKRYDALEVSNLCSTDKEGTYPIGPAVLKMRVVDTRASRAPFGRDFFDDDFFGFGASRSVSVASNPVELTVVPFPQEGRPQDFSGLIGRFTVRADLEPKTVQEGESATLTVTMEGQGNVHLMPELKLPPIEGVKTYADKPVMEVTTTSDGSTGSKTMKWALVPQKPGKVVVPSLGFGHLEPYPGTYSRAQTSSLILDVRPGDQAAHGHPALSDNGSHPEKKQVEVLGQDILPIHEDPSALKPPAWCGWNSWKRLGLFFLPLVPFAASLLAQTLSRRQGERTSEAMARKALRLFQNETRGLGPEGLPDLLKAVGTFLNRRMCLAGGSLTAVEAEGKLRERGVPADTARRFGELMADLETSVFSGKRVADTRAFKQELDDILRLVDRSIVGWRAA
ncbi:BatD family protein [Thermodesulfobacteriota bacterium]